MGTKKKWGFAMTLLSGEPLTGQAPDIEPLPAEHPPVMSYAQERLWFMEQLKPGTRAALVNLR